MQLSQQTALLLVALLAAAFISQHAEAAVPAAAAAPAPAAGVGEAAADATASCHLTLTGGPGREQAAWGDAIPLQAATLACTGPGKVSIAVHSSLEKSGTFSGVVWNQKPACRELAANCLVAFCGRTRVVITAQLKGVTSNVAGAALCFSGRSRATLRRSLLQSNIVSGGHLVLATGNATLALTDTEVTQNTCGMGQLGANEFAEVTVKRSTFSQNMGRAVYLVDSANLDISGTKFAANQLQDWGGFRTGGAIWAAGNGSLLIRGGSSFTGNSIQALKAGGGAIYSERSVTIRNSSFSGNYAQGEMAMGGALWVNKPGVLTISDGSSFEHNTVNGLLAMGGAFYGTAATEVTDSSFTENAASGDMCGGAVAWATGPGSLSLRRSLFARNTAISAGTSQGGAVYLATDASVDGCTFDSNYIDSMASKGAAILAARGTLSLANTVLANNTASGPGSRGGALFSTAASVSISRSTFGCNKAEQGAAFAVGPETTLSATEAVLGTDATTDCLPRRFSCHAPAAGAARKSLLFTQHDLGDAQLPLVATNARSNCVWGGSY